MRARRLWLGLLGTLALAGLPTDAGAQPVGSEFQVNTYTTFSQDTAHFGRAVAADASGNFIVVWESRLQDGDLGGVFAQRYDSDGQALGTEFLVNSYTTQDQIRPAVAAAADGDFVVVWEGFGRSGGGIFGQRFDSAGEPLGSHFRVNTSTEGSQLHPSVASDAPGNFVVAWPCLTQYGYCGIRARRFDSEGVAQGEDFLVSSNGVGSSDVASDASGNFVVVWEGLGEGEFGTGIFGQRYDNAGEALGTEFLVNSYTTSTQGYASAAFDASGNFVVVWISYQDGSGRGVFGRRFDAAGGALGPDFRVNSYTTGDQENPSVARDENGNFIVVWESNDQDGDSDGVFGQRYNSAGVAQGVEFQVNSFTTSRQYKATASSTGSDQFAVVWSSLYQDGDSDGVFGQRFDFAAGDTITVVSPNTNVRWLIGSVQNIKWTHNLGLNATFRIELDREDDGTYEERIATEAPVDNATKGFFGWTVNGPPSATARVRVSWTGNPSVSDSSNETFQIRTGLTS